MPTTLINTKDVQTRRKLHFDNLDQLTAEIDRLADAETSGKLTLTGNWTLGQIFNHLATWIDYAYDGFPLKVPWILRLCLRPMKRIILYKPMRPAARIPGIKGGTLAIDPAPTADALAHLHRAIARIATEPAKFPNPLFGQLTKEEWINLHLRHAELHLSFANVNA